MPASAIRKTRCWFGPLRRPRLHARHDGHRLNLGLTDITVQGLVKRSGDARFAYDSYRRFIQMYGNVVLGVEHHHFEDILENVKRDRTSRSIPNWSPPTGRP